MRRERPLLEQLAARLLSLAIALVVGLQFGPELAPQTSSAPRVWSAELRVADDALKAGERPEPRVAPAPVVDRLPAVRATDVVDVARRTATRVAAGVATSDGPSAFVRVPIVKHVPRLERGDPPRS
jgi:hypothetical protein